MLCRRTDILQASPLPPPMPMPPMSMPPMSIPAEVEASAALAVVELGMLIPELIEAMLDMAELLIPDMSMSATESWMSVERSNQSVESIEKRIR